MSAPSTPTLAEPSIETLVWEGIAMTVTHTPRMFADIDHIEIRVADRQPLPITQTGYRSHWVRPDQLEAYGSASAFIRAWLDTEAQSKAWQDHLARSRQLTLL